MAENQKLTSVKLDENLLDLFKIACVKYKFSFQKLSERCTHLFLTDEEFRKKVMNHKDLKIDETI